MTTIVIGDIHGRNVWKDIVNKEGTDVRYIFVGDYWDSYDIPHNDQYGNFLDLCEFKMNNMDSVTLLRGNHDELLYKHGNYCSGYQELHKDAIRGVFKNFEGLFEVATVLPTAGTDYLVTHAGITKLWLDEHIDEYSDLDDLADKLNKLWYDDHRGYLFKSHYKMKLDLYGKNINQGPMWVRPSALLESYVDFDQIVGHTYNSSLHYQITKSKCKIFFVDSLPEYLMIDEVNKYKIKKV